MPRKPGQPRKDPRLPGLPRKTPSPFDATVQCMRCALPFASVDRRTNRICERCSEFNSKLSLRETSRPTVVPPGVFVPGESTWD